MAKSSSSPGTKSRKNSHRHEIYKSNYYFDNEKVERLLYRYHETSCTDVDLRDQIMVSAGDLIDNLIKAHNLGQICPGKDDASINDLYQVAWVQIESALYKYEARPHCKLCYNTQRPNDSLIADEFVFIDDVVKRFKRCKKCGNKFTRGNIESLWLGFDDDRDDEEVVECNIYYRGTSKIFNLWSQIGRTVILAHIKKENRDKKNSPLLQNHLENKAQNKSFALERFLNEAKQICKYNQEYNRIIEALEELYDKDDRAHDGMIGKLVDETDLSRQTITNFLKFIRLRSEEFTDSPMNEEDQMFKRKSDDNEQDPEY